MRAKTFMQPKPPPDIKEVVGTIYRGLIQKSQSLTRMGEKFAGKVYEDAAADVAVTAITSGWMTLDELCENIKG